MKQLLVLFFLSILSLFSFGQDDWSWWNQQHGWETGMPGWRNWIIISPGYLGPNALPVPEVKKGFLTNNSAFELTASNHALTGDPTQDISGRAYIPFAQGKIAVEMYGVIYERYAFSEELRNERFARNKNGKGSANGDLYFTTLIQVFKDRKFPNTLFRAALKTASGNDLKGARYSDAPGYYFDLSFSKDYGRKETLVFRPYTMLGFYSWQTNDEDNLQNDAILYGAGTDFVKNNWMFTASWSGYRGYKNNGDRPMQLNFELRKDYDKKAFRIQYQHGLHDWLYKTVRFSFIWKFKGIS